MKKAKRLLVYLVCAGTILFLLVCAGVMGHSIVVQSGDAFFWAASALRQAAHLFRNFLCIAVTAWLVLRYLESPVHRRDLSGYALVLLAATALWFGLRALGYYDPVVIDLPWPRHFAVFIDLALFLPFLILEAAAFFFLRYRGKQNYPEEYRNEWNQVKLVLPRLSAMKAAFLVVVILLSFLTFWCYTNFGYRETLSAIVFGYDVSDDGSYMLLHVGNTYSFWSYSEYEVVQNGSYLDLTFYSDHGPAYMSNDDAAPYPCRVDLPPDCTGIRVYDPQWCTYDLYLKLDEETGKWLLRQRDIDSTEYYYVDAESELWK